MESKKCRENGKNESFEKIVRQQGEKFVMHKKKPEKILEMFGETFRR